MPLDQDDELNKTARDHAWDWFALHARQRMQSFNYFLVATAFLVAGYGSLLDKRPAAAAGVALVGVWIAVWFNRLDRRSRQLVLAGERALEVAQARLAERTDIADLKILEGVSTVSPGASSYRQVISVIQRTVALLFILGATYATWLAAFGR